MAFFKSLFKGMGWNSLPSDVVEYVTPKFSVKEFHKLTELCLDYNLFPQMVKVVAKEPDFGLELKIPFEDRVDHLAIFFTNVGREIGMQAQQEGMKLLLDSIEFLKAALILKPDWFPARSLLAFAYIIIRKNQEAKDEAIRALADWDKWIAYEKENPIPQDMKELIHLKEQTEDEEQQDSSVRNSLISITKGEFGKE